MKLFGLLIIAFVSLFTACSSANEITMPESFESKIKMTASLDYTCQYDVNQDGESELIGCYSYEKSVVKTYLVYDDTNGLQEYTFGPGGDNVCTTCIIKDKNINETYMALVTRGGLACKVIRLNTPDKHSSVAEVWRERSIDGNKVNISYYYNGEETDKKTVVDYFKNLEMIEPEAGCSFSDESFLSYWTDN